MRWQGGRFLVLFKGGGLKVRPKFYRFVSGVNQKKRRSRICSRNFCVAAGLEKFFLDLTQTVTNMAGCRSVSNCNR